MEDYEKKYKEALSRAATELETCGADKSLRNMIYAIFPDELKESEDERIRKALIRFHKSTIDVDGIKGDDIIAWLEKQVYTKKDIDDAYLKGICDAKHELEKQGKSSDQIHYWTEEEIEPIIHDYLRGVEHYGGMIGRLRCLKPKSIEKQGNSSVKWQKNTLYNKPAINHSVLMKTTQGIAEGEWQGEYWFQYRWSWTLKDSDVLAWMELSDLSEQGEQKTAVTDFNAKDWYVSKVDGKIHDMTYNPADKVEPKFKIGDWVIKDCTVAQILDKHKYAFVGLDINGNEFVCNYGHISSMKHWTIQDAKDGDVLISQSGNPLIYNGNYNSLDIGAYCGITCDDNKFKVAEEKCHWTENVDIKPSTKEQRDLLFTKMKEAGYEWDAEKKELKLLITNGGDFEPKQEWSEKDEKIALSIEQVMNCASLLNLVPEKIEKVRAWLKHLKDRKGG